MGPKEDKSIKKHKKKKHKKVLSKFIIYLIKFLTLQEKKKKRKRKSSDSDEPQWIESKPSKPSAAPAGIGPQMVKTEPIGPEMPQYVFILNSFIFC